MVTSEATVPLPLRDSPAMNRNSHHCLVVLIAYGGLDFIIKVVTLQELTTDM